MSPPNHRGGVSDPRRVRLDLPFDRFDHQLDPANLVVALEEVGFEVAGIKGGNVYLGRYRLPWWMRSAMEIVLRAGGLVGMGAKVHALARKPFGPEKGR